MDLWGTGRREWMWMELGKHYFQRMVNGCGERQCSAVQCSNVWRCIYLIMLAVCSQKSHCLTVEGLKKKLSPRNLDHTEDIVGVVRTTSLATVTDVMFCGSPASL